MKSNGITGISRSSTSFQFPRSHSSENSSGEVSLKKERRKRLNSIQEFFIEQLKNSVRRSSYHLQTQLPFSHLVIKASFKEFTLTSLGFKGSRKTLKAVPQPPPPLLLHSSFLYKTRITPNIFTRVQLF